MKLKSYLKHIILVFIIPLALCPIYSDASEWKLKISVEKANIRLEPDIKSPVVSTALKGTILESYEKVGEWFRVVLGPDEKGFTVIGYIHLSDVDIIREKTTKEPDFWGEEPEFFREIGLRIKLSGGLNYFFAGDIDKGIRGLYDSMADFLSSAGYTLDKRTESFHTGLDISGDIIFYVKPRLGIGLGAGFIRATETNLLIVSGKDIIEEQKIGSTPTISVVPIRLGLFFTLPIHRLFSISFNGGTALYLAKYSYSLATVWDDMNIIGQNANAKGLGFHGGIGLEVKLNQRASFIIEGQGRYAKISNFKGEEIEREKVAPNNVYSVENGMLYYLEDEKYPYLAIRKEEPSGFKTIRKATFDLSGFSLRAGLIIKF